MENIFENSAWLYDLDIRDNLKVDIPFYVDYAKQHNGNILELGCGTGRVAYALAVEGFHVTGLDLSPYMLDIFRRKLTENPFIAEKITIVQGDMINFTLNRRFNMIIAPFRVFQAVTENDEVESSLACIHKHLTDEGIFIINVFNPHSVLDQNWRYEETIQWERVDEKTGNHVVKKHWGDKIDTVKQIIYPHFSYEVTYPNGVKERVVDDLKLKYYYYDQLKTVIEKAHMKIIEQYSWYDKSPINGREIIFVCKKNNQGE